MDKYQKIITWTPIVGFVYCVIMFLMFVLTKGERYSNYIQNSNISGAYHGCFAGLIISYYISQ